VNYHTQLIVWARFLVIHFVWAGLKVWFSGSLASEYLGLWLWVTESTWFASILLRISVPVFIRYLGLLLLLLLLSSCHCILVWYWYHKGFGYNYQDNSGLVEWV
jgi:hypothetical protein